jgi:IclR family pca regulon transcriptional regulator
MTTETKEGTAPGGRYLQSVDRMGGFAKGLAVIEAFGQGKNSLTIAEVARLSNLDRASTRRCLLTLVEAGYAATDGRYFELTPRILRLGHSYLAASLPRLIQPTLDMLADDIKESCSAAVLDGAEVVYIARAAHHRIVGPGLHPGSRLPAFCSSLGRVLLAALPLDQAQAILEQSERPSITHLTLTEVPRIMAEVARARGQGYAIIDQEMEIGSRSIAVPVTNFRGQTVAAITVGVHAVRAETERLKLDILPRLLNAKSQLAAILP